MGGKWQFSLQSLLLCVTVTAIYCAGAAALLRVANPILREAGIGYRQVFFLDLLAIAPLTAVAAIAFALIVGQRRTSGDANLTPCPDCGRMVSRLAVACPQCGRPLTPSVRV